jgi:P4 family phage/plasmid primase-like protien
MIQILALREFYSEKKKKMIKAEVWFEKGLRATTVEEVFSLSTQLLKGVNSSERWNLYYTVADCLEEPGRKLLVQHHIPFDVDGIKIEEDEHGKPLVEPLQILAKVVCEAIGVKYDQCGVLFSGNGVQIIVGTTKTIEDVTYFDQNRHHYGAICDRIDLRLMQAGIQGKADRSVWSPARLMRFPETENKKAGRPSRVGILLNGTMERVDFDIKQVSGLPDVPAKDQISQKVVDQFPTPDVKTIMDPVEGCQFLHWAQTMPEKVTEPEWYAMVSITARFPEGRKFTHKLSEGHKGYSFEETEQKITQSIESSGPRTCKNINAISGGKCATCKHHNTKLVSPILIEGPDHVKTAKTGFHNVFITPEGGVKKGKPDFEGLQKYFSKEFKYKAIMEAGSIWIWNGQHYEEMSKDIVYKYAQDKFEPKPNKQMRSEFFEFVRLAELVKPSWFTTSIEGRMNFQNGILDVKTGILSPHSTEYGFRSVLPCEFDPKARAPKFEEFINQVTLERQDLIDLLQEFMGYIFANGDCKHEKILVLLGDGSNGKSRFVELIRALAGKDGFSSLSVKGMNLDQNRYLMEGKLVNIAEENSKDSFRDTELIKNFASGGYISVKKLYSQPYEYQNRTKLVMLCNTPPSSGDNTYGFYRKLLMVPFDQTFSDEKGNKDPDILYKMLAELPGIFNWVMEGYKRLEKNNRFTESQASKTLLAKYQADTNTLLAWANDYLEFDENRESECNRQELYDDYVAYCSQAGLPAQSAHRMYDFLRSFIRRRGGIVNEHKRTVDKNRIWTINHIKHLSVVSK